MIDLRLGDFLLPGGIAKIADGAVAHTIADPPYSEHVHGKSMRGLTVTHRGGATDEISERRDLGFEPITLAEIRAASIQFVRVTQRWILVFSDVESSHPWRESLEEAGAEYTRTLAWVKLGGAPQFTGDRPAVGFEAITAAHSRRTRKRWNGGGKAGVYVFPTAIDRDRTGLDERYHTTQKPLALMEELVMDFSDPDELVCDPYAGSATTLAACYRLGRLSLGWEKNPKTHADALRRLDTISPFWRAPARHRRSGPRQPRAKQAKLL